MFLGRLLLIRTNILFKTSTEYEIVDNTFVASIFMNEYYGFDVEAVSNDIGVVDENGDEVEEDD